MNGEGFTYFVWRTHRMACYSQLLTCALCDICGFIGDR